MLSRVIEPIRVGLDGGKNTLARDTDIERLAESRLAACTDCKHQRAMICGRCGCPLLAKTRSLEASCPAARW